MAAAHYTAGDSPVDEFSEPNVSDTWIRHHLCVAWPRGGMELGAPFFP